MTMENSGHEDRSPPAATTQPGTHAQVPNPSRRRFNRAGVGVSAVVLTLASRSVLAKGACTTASGFHSINQSTGAETSAQACNGMTPEAWMTRDPWPLEKTTAFTSVFGPANGSLECGAPINTMNTLASKGNNDNGNGGGIESERKLKDATLEQAMAGSKTPPVVKHLIASLLNAELGANTHPSRESVIEIFQEWQAKNFYEVSAGVKWTEADIIAYLRATQPRTF